MRTVSKGRIFGFNSEISDELMNALHRVPEILQQANADGAIYWHEGILPQHFRSEAHDRYGYATRAKNYLKRRRSGSKAGKPDLIFTGSMFREMTNRRAITATATGAKLVLKARVLNFVPRMQENDQSLYVTHRARNGGTRTYPNMKREVKVILDDEREAVAQVVARSIERQMQGHQQGAAA